MPNLRRWSSDRRGVLLLVLVAACLDDGFAEKRPLPVALQTGFYLSPLRKHPTTATEFGITSTREFLDLMKHSTPFTEGVEQGEVGNPSSFVPYGIPAGTTVSFREDGYPSSLPSFLQYGKVRQTSAKATIGRGGAFVEDGEYVAKWEGVGNVSFEGDAQLLSSGKQSARILVRPANGVVVRIFGTSSENPLRALSLVPLAYAELDPRPLFHPQFLETLRGTSVLRFAGWQQVDEWDHPGSVVRQWTNRSLPAHQTQAGRWGVSVEYMVQLANALGAHPWFSMPKAAAVGSGVIDPYASSFAELVRTSLRADLRVFVEYRSCCVNGLAPGWDSQENAVQSLTLWSSWEATWNASRVVNLISSLQQVDKFGTDIGRVEAAAIDVSFGTVCGYGGQPCVAYDAIGAYGTYGNSTSDDLIDEVLWPAMLRQESEVNKRVQQALHYKFEVVAFNAIPLVSARNYGHRGTLNWALQCERCLMQKVGHRYGLEEREALAKDGYLFEEGLRVYYAYEGISPDDRAQVNGSYWFKGPAAEAKTKCSIAAACRGFTYIKSGEWSCGIGAHRYGDCEQPGTAYFFNLTRAGQAGRVPPTSCEAFSEPGAEDCTPSSVDSYFKVSAIDRTTQLAAEEAAVTGCSVCQYSYNQQWYTQEIPQQGYSLDRLHRDWPMLIEKAAEEQRLEMKMATALRSDAVEGLMLHYLENLRQLGFSTIVGGSLHLQMRMCREGGKACGITSIMLHPDDNGPVRRALESYSIGIRGPAVERAGQQTSSVCAQPCIYGVCEGGSCRCWERASGADCSVLDTSPRCEGELGLSLSGVNYWTREWIFVDVFKHVGDWQVQEFTSYSWNTGDKVEYRADGYPALLYVNQLVQLLTVRDVEKHYTDGWYTIFYDGDGIMDFNMDITAVRRVKPGHIRIHVRLQTTGNNGIGVRISRTSETNPIRNIRIVTPGFEDTYSTSPFHPAFKASLQRFSVLRFMDWMHANNEGTPWTWEGRSTPEYYTQGVQKGVSLEHMVGLANEMAKDPWFSLPINATGDFLHRFAELVAGNLRPDVTVYVEMGNEVWHTGFFGGQWAVKQGAIAGLSSLCWYAKRTAEMAAIVKAVLAPPRRVVVVAGSQTVNADATRQLLHCDGINASDAVGLGPYFNGYNVLPSPDADLDAVLASYEAQIAESVRLVREHKALLSGTHFKLVAYEAGPAGEGDGSGTDLAIQAHRHPRMRQIVKDYLEALDQEMDLLVYFASCGKPSKYGSWGLVEAMDQPREEAVKYLAVQDFLDARSTCPAEQRCAGFAGCNGQGICGTDDECYCYRGFSGATCLAASFTDYVACGYRCTFDQGTCQVSQVIGNVRAWDCGCREAYGGATCSTFQCQDGCNQRGHCIASGVCSCFRGFRGDVCEVDCGCDHHGQCNSKNQCVCDRGWRNKAVGRGCEWNCDTVDSLGCVGPGQSACRDCQMGTCIEGACSCWAGYHGAACSLQDSSLRGNFESPFGVNVALSHSMFVDVMKTSREWTSVWNVDTFAGQFSYQGGSLIFEDRQYEWGNGQAILEDDAEYVTSLAPNQAVITLALRDVCLHAPSGRYVVTYDGDGEIDFGMDAQPNAFQKGRIDIDLSLTCKAQCWFDKKTWDPYCTDNGIAATVRSTNPANPIRNIRIIMPGFFAVHETEPFHPWFLKNLERFSFLRFMNWGQTNSDAFVKRRPVPARFVRFTALSTKGGGAPRMAEFLLKAKDGSRITCTSSLAPELCDGDPNTDWAPAPKQGGLESVVVELPEGTEVSSYMWMTSGYQMRVDPQSWLLEVSLNGTTWSVLDRRSTNQQVTYNRRVFSALESQEERSWYPIRRPEDLLEWADRTLPTHRSQTIGPVASEYQVLLANTLGSAPWVCVHHLASDDFVRKEAAFWLEHLRSDMSVYIEHSNEVWNPLFPQGRYATEKGTALGLVDASCKSGPEHCARLRYNARRSQEIFAIWKEVWGASRPRLRFVLSTQTAWNAPTQDLLSSGTVGADLLGITGYMSPASSIDYSWAAKTPEDVIAAFQGGIENKRAILRGQKALAEAAGLGVVVYEGGVGLVEDGAIESGKATGFVTELLIATGRSPAFQSAVKAWLDMFREELGDATKFGYFVDTGFWSKYGQWGMREYFDAATATSPAAAAVHAHLDERQGPRRSCVVAMAGGRGLPPDSFFGPPAVLEPGPGFEMVVGHRYSLRWSDAGRLPKNSRYDLYLWQWTSCSGSPIPLGWANARAGEASWQVPDVTVGGEYFLELRPQAPVVAPSNYSAFFSILSPEHASLDYVLYVETDVDLLSAFHRDCKKNKDWALVPSFKINSCVYSSAEGCRTYRTLRKSPSADGPPPWLHGSFKPLTDCTLHVIGVRQTLRLEGLTRGFDLGAEDSLARIVANVSLLPPGAVSVKLVGTTGGRRLSATSVDLEIQATSDDGGLELAALGLATLSSNAAFAKAAGDSLGTGSLSVVAGNITADEGGVVEASSDSGGGRCVQVDKELVKKISAKGFRVKTCDNV
mmetsp:Transcript_134092/g.428462  ORF Transcript_134092/g.428462 Transcript_134092/m.428462 type:complete len:2501 (-) Transcript_134092:185-7687(-)